MGAEDLAHVCPSLLAKGARTVGAGCTEVSVLLDAVDTDLRVVDAPWELAVASVTRATATTAHDRVRRRWLTQRQEIRHG